MDQDNLGGTETNSCTDNPLAMCDVWNMTTNTGKKVWYQEYAQTAACGCVGCNAGTADPHAHCKTVDGTDGPNTILNGCTPKAVTATPYVQEMRKSCSWGYAYPFDDNQGGLTCTGAKSLIMTVADGSDGPNSGGEGQSNVWEIVIYIVVGLLLLGSLGCNYWQSFIAWPPFLALLSVYVGCLALAWVVWKGIL